MTDPRILREAQVMKRWCRRFHATPLEFVRRHAAKYAAKHPTSRSGESAPLLPTSITGAAPSLRRAA